MKERMAKTCTPVRSWKQQQHLVRVMVIRLGDLDKRQSNKKYIFNYCKIVNFIWQEIESEWN